MELHEILTVPMQRFLKYPLLLKALIAETPHVSEWRKKPKRDPKNKIYIVLHFKTHDDYRGLENAREAMLEVAAYTNEVKCDSENLELIRQVKERIVDLQLPDGNDLFQYGRLVHNGELGIKSFDDKEVRNLYAFVFHKLLILVERIAVSLWKDIKLRL